MAVTTEAPARRTKRRYAHELYPHAAEGETRPLAVEVPYLYARALGYEVSGTGWFDAHSKGAIRTSMDRTESLIQARRIAFAADALLQGLSGDEAWRWADERNWDETGEWTCQRAIHYGVPYQEIKPYPCGPEPDHHDHYSEPDAHGWRNVTQVDGRESDCPDCTEPAEEAS